MRQFDVVPNPSERSRPAAPFVVVLQSHHLASMPTAVVAPLFRPDVRVAYSEVSLEVEVGSDRYVAAVGDLAAIDVRQLGKPVGDLKHMEDALRRALERLFTGF